MDDLAEGTVSVGHGAIFLSYMPRPSLGRFGELEELLSAMR